MLIEVKSGNGNSGNNQDQDFGYNQYVNLFKKGSICIDYLCDEKIHWLPTVSKIIVNKKPRIKLNKLEYIKIINVKTDILNRKNISLGIS